MNPRTQRRQLNRQRGASSLFITVILVLVVMLLAVTAAVLSSTQFKLAGNLQYENVAFNLAEGALVSAESWLSGNDADGKPNAKNANFTTYAAGSHFYPIGALAGLTPAIDPQTMTDDLGFVRARRRRQHRRCRRHPALPDREVRRRQPAAGHRDGRGRSPAHRLPESGRVPGQRPRHERQGHDQARADDLQRAQLLIDHSHDIDTQMRKGPTMKTTLSFTRHLLLACVLGQCAALHAAAIFTPNNMPTGWVGEVDVTSFNFTDGRQTIFKGGLRQGRMVRQPVGVPGGRRRHRPLRRGTLERRRGRPDIWTRRP